MSHDARHETPAPPALAHQVVVQDAPRIHLDRAPAAARRSPHALSLHRVPSRYASLDVTTGKSVSSRTARSGSAPPRSRAAAASRAKRCSPQGVSGRCNPNAHVRGSARAASRTRPRDAARPRESPRRQKQHERARTAGPRVTRHARVPPVPAASSTATAASPTPRASPPPSSRRRLAPTDAAAPREAALALTSSPRRVASNAPLCSLTPLLYVTRSTGISAGECAWTVRQGVQSCSRAKKRQTRSHRIGRRAGKRGILQSMNGRKRRNGPCCAGK